MPNDKVFRLPNYFIENIHLYSHSEFQVIAGICATFTKGTFITKPIGWSLIGYIIRLHPVNVSKHYSAISPKPWKSSSIKTWVPKLRRKVKSQIIDMSQLSYQYQVVPQQYLTDAAQLKIWLLRFKSTNQINKLTGIRWAEIKLWKEVFSLGEQYESRSRGTQVSEVPRKEIHL